MDRVASILDQRDCRNMNALDPARVPGISARHDSRPAGVQSRLSVLDSYRGRAAHDIRSDWHLRQAAQSPRAGG